MRSLLWLLDTVISLYMLIIIAQVIVSWLIAFRVINMGNPFVRSLAEALYRLTEPALRPIRNVLPVVGGLDLSPLVLWLLLMFVRNLLYEYWPVV